MESKKSIHSLLLIYKYRHIWYTTTVIPHVTSCGGYNVFEPSVRQSVSLIFLVSATPLKPLKRISWNFIVMKDIMCRCAHPQETLIQFFSLLSTPFLNLDFWPKWKILLKQFVNTTPLKPLNRISWNEGQIVHIHRKFWFNFFRNYALFELRILTKMKNITVTVCQRNYSEAAQQNFLKLCSYEGHNA